MVKENFQLQPVLTYKSRIEDVKQQELAEIQKIYRHEVSQLLELQGRHAVQLDRLRDKQIDDRLDIDTIVQEARYLAGLANAVETAARRLEDTGRKVEDKRQELVAAVQEKKVLEKLKEKQHLEFRDSQKKLEAKQVDELVTTRYKRRERVL